MFQQELIQDQHSSAINWLGVSDVHVPGNLFADCAYLLFASRLGRRRAVRTTATIPGMGRTAAPAARINIERGVEAS